jgi:hypothetical protein
MFGSLNPFEISPLILDALNLAQNPEFSVSNSLPFPCDFQGPTKV